MVHLSMSIPSSQYTVSVKKASARLTEVIASPVMSVKKWREQMKMEKNAGFAEDKSTLVSDISCDSCRIFIGRDHEEQELYFLPLLRQYAKLKHGKRFYEHAVFHLCGDCARRRGLPESMQFFGHSVWQTRRHIPMWEIIEAERLLYTQVMGLWKLKQEMPGWAWWSEWIPPLVLPLPIPLHKKATQEVPGHVVKPQIQGAIDDIDSLLRALSVMSVPTFQEAS